MNFSSDSFVIKSTYPLTIRDAAFILLSNNSSSLSHKKINIFVTFSNATSSQGVS
jgi:hypothetical protein